MDAVSTSSLYQSALLNIMSAQKSEQVAEAQAGSEKVASNLDGYAGSAGSLVATNSLQSRIGSYLSNTQAISDRLGVQTQALQQVASSAQDATTAIQNAAATGDASGLIDTLQGDFGSAADALNTSYNGQYLFAGGQTETPPFSTSSLTDLASAPVASQFTNDQSPTTNRLDDNTVITTGVLASNVGTPIMQALQAVQQYNAGPNGPLTGTLNSTQTSFLQSVVSQFSSAITSANSVAAQSGETQTQVTNAQTALTDQQTALSGVISDITVPDEAQVASNLTLAQTALQASAQVFSSLQSDSLLNILSPASAG